MTPESYLYEPHTEDMRLVGPVLDNQEQRINTLEADLKAETERCADILRRYIAWTAPGLHRKMMRQILGEIGEAQ